MEQTQRFRVGDRVHMIGTSGQVSLGIQGTVERVFVVSNLYEVRCDDRAWRRVVHHNDLELIKAATTVNA